jgi:hypothetical protein
MRGTLQSLALLAAALLLSAAAAELVLRLRLDPVDYLQPRLAPHPVLRHVIVPGSGHHDAWGFRNAEVPERVEILAVGDSQTYGVSAPARESWPAWLESLSGRRVYNLSLGGYGPPDYHYLLRELGLSLDPEIVVIGFYLGNDLPRAADVAAGRSRPSRALRGGDDPRLLGPLRSWLAGHSVLYQALKFGLPRLTEALRFREAAARDDAVAVEHPVARTFLTPGLRLAALDQERPRNRKGLDATLAELEAIADTCRAHELRCVDLLIPTKESVYWELAREQLAQESYARLARLVSEEEAVRRAMVGRLQELGVEWVDPLPALRARVGEARLYPANADGHPLGAGYRVIAASVLRQLRDGGPG